LSRHSGDDACEANVVKAHTCAWNEHIQVSDKMRVLPDIKHCGVAFTAYVACRRAVTGQAICSRSLLLEGFDGLAVPPFEGARFRADPFSSATRINRAWATKRVL